MMRPTVIRQPGTAAQPRRIAVESHGERIVIDLREGENLLAELRRGFAARGFAGGVATFSDLALGPFAYVMPALSKTGENAAFYSDTYRPEGVTRIETAAITVGERDGAPFFHCHAIWREASGKRIGGHILPEDTVVAASTQIEALALDGAVFAASYDPETNFKLFAPREAAVDRMDRGYRVIALRLKPNQDFLSALESVAEDFGIKHARICGGVGSLIGASFASGMTVNNFATEVLITRVEITLGTDGHAKAYAEAALVDYTQALAAGVLVKGANPVLMTFELALEVLE